MVAQSFQKILAMPSFFIGIDICLYCRQKVRKHHRCHTCGICGLPVHQGKCPKTRTRLRKLNPGEPLPRVAYRLPVNNHPLGDRYTALTLIEFYQELNDPIAVAKDMEELRKHDQSMYAMVENLSFQDPRCRLTIN